jgi:hypothetical protein
MTSPPRSAHPPGWSRTQRWAFAGFAAIGTVSLALLYFHRPEGQFFFPRCTFHQTTGLLCPGCGSLRATHALLHGRLLEAVQSNLLLVAGIPSALVVWLWGRRQGRPLSFNATWVWWLFGVAAAFTVARNLPFAASRWLCP